eukprot:5042327-Prymnesium_polylepis.1
MRVRGGGLAAGSTPAENRKPRHPCALRVCSGRLHSGSAPIQTLGNAPLPPELKIAILTAAAPKLKVLR